MDGLNENRERLLAKVRELTDEIADIRAQQSRVGPTAEWYRHLTQQRRLVARKLVRAQSELAALNEAIRQERVAAAAERAALPKRAELMKEVERLRAILVRAGIDPGIGVRQCGSQD